MENTQELRQFVNCIFDTGDTVEIRCLKDGTKPRRGHEQFWCSASELPGHIQRLANLNASGWNIYAGVNPRAKRGSKAADVKLARVVFVDFDGIDLATARQQLDALDAPLPPPALIIKSGHGVHVYWLLSEPLTDLAKWTDAQKQLAAALNADRTVHDPPRIMRLPGFLNVKADPYVACRIVECRPERRTSLEALLAALPRENTRAGAASPVERARAYVATIPGVAEGTRNHEAYKTACKLARDFDLPDTQAWPLLCDWNNRNVPPLSESELRAVLASARGRAHGEPGSKLNDNPLGTRARAEWELRFKAHGPEALGSDEIHGEILATLTAVDKCSEQPRGAEAVKAAVDSERRAIAKREGVAGNDGDWRLVIVQGDPPIYRLWSPYWTNYVELTSSQMRSVRAIEVTALDQRQAWVPEQFRKIWLGTKSAPGMASKLTASAEREEAPPELRRDEQIKQAVLDQLHRDANHRAVLGEGMKPASVSELPRKDDTGGIYFLSEHLKESMSRLSLKPSPGELFAALQALHVGQRTVGTGNRSRKVRYLPAGEAANGNAWRLPGTWDV